MAEDLRVRRHRSTMDVPLPETESDIESGEIEIDLVDLLYRLLDNLKYVILASVLCAIIAGAYTVYFMHPQYQATAKLYVVNSRDSAINLADLQIGSFLTSDYQEVFKTWEVHEEVLTDLNLNYTYKQLQGMLSVTNPANTRVLNITVTSGDPKEATLIANKYAGVAQDYIQKTMDTQSPNVLSAALEPTAPIGPNKTRNVLLGFILGAFLTIAIITVRFLLDDKLKNADDIRKYVGMETLAVIRKLDMSVMDGSAKRIQAKGDGK